MGTYWYSVKMSRPVRSDEVESIRSAIGKAFGSSTLPDVNGDVFSVHSDVDPVEAQNALDRLAGKYGVCKFTAGVRKE